MKNIFCLLFLFCNLNVLAQSDSVNEIYYDKIISYTDVGYYSCPFEIKINQLGTLNYRNNIKPFIGIGFNYKWGSLRIGSLINYNLKGLENFGSTKIFKIGTEFFYKRFLFDLSFYRLKGYTLVDNSNFTTNQFNIYDDITFQSSALNTWFFINKNFSHHALKGIKQAVKKNNWSLYFKNTNGYTSIQNNASIIPSDLNNSKSISYDFTKINAFEMGLLFGVATAIKFKHNFQLGSMFGYGGVLIDRSLNTGQHNKNWIGLSSRYDFHIYGGYNKKNFFLMNYLDLEQRNIQFTNFEVNSRLISYRLVVGYRF